MKRLFIALLVMCALVAAPAWAATTPNSIITAQTPKNGEQNFIQGTDAAGTFKTVYTAGANGSKCNAISVANTDSTATHLVSFEIVNGGNTYLVSSFVTASPAIGAIGTAGALTNWNGLGFDSDGNPFIQLVSGDLLKATFATALTGALTPVAQITVLASCTDF